MHKKTIDVRGVKLTVAELAKMLGCSARTIEGRLSRGLDALTGKTGKPKPTAIDDHSVTMRAVAAWARRAQRHGGGIPNLDAVSVQEVGGRTYVVWRERGDLVGCYRVRHDGKLKLLKRPPAELAS